jgi:hypothetical protein
VRERADANRTREAGHLDEIQGAVANTLKLSWNGAVGFIDWLDDQFCRLERIAMTRGVSAAVTALQRRSWARPWCCPPPWCNAAELAGEVDHRAAVEGTSGNAHGVAARHHR